MMLPSMTFELVNPGSGGRPASSDQIPIYCGVAESGTLASVYTFGTEAAARAALTRGHLLDVVRFAFARGASEVKAMRLTAAVAGSLGTQAAENAPAGTLTITGTLSSRMRARVEITGAGDNGVAIMRWCLDYWEIPGVNPTWVENVLVPADGTFTPPGTALVFTFDDSGGSHAVGDAWTQDIYPGHYGATEIAACATPVRAPAAGDANVLVFTGEPPPGVANAGATTANTNLAAIASLVNSLFGSADFYGALAGCSEASAASVITATADTVCVPPWLSPGYGKAYVTNPAAQRGRAMMALGEAEAAFAARIAGSLISTDPARTASGALPGVVATNHDARAEGGALEAARISTLRTWHRRLSPGVFIARQRLLDAETGDFYSWQDAAIMIASFRAVHPVAWLMIADGFRQNADGTLDPSEAESLDSGATRALGAVLLQPTNARGFPGHVTAASARAARNVALPAVRIDFAIRRLGYATDLTFSLRYSGEV